MRLATLFDCCHFTRIVRELKDTKYTHSQIDTRICELYVMNKEKWEREKKKQVKWQTNKQTIANYSVWKIKSPKKKRGPHHRKSKSQLVRFGLVGGIVLVVLVIHWILVVSFYCHGCWFVCMFSQY